MVLVHRVGIHGVRRPRHGATRTAGVVERPGVVEGRTRTSAARPSGVVIMLNVMSAVALATGFRVKFIAYRLCPVIFTGSTLLVVAALL